MSRETPTGWEALPTIAAATWKALEQLVELGVIALAVLAVVLLGLALLLNLAGGGHR